MSRTGGFRSPVWLAPVIALGALVLCLLLFSPQYILWPQLGQPILGEYPDLHRASSALAQLRHPFAPMENPDDQVLRYRLLFPVLGHYLGFPPRLFLSLPYLGCLAALSYIVRLVLAAGGRTWEAFAVATVAGTSAWLFVSTGWLSYPDSWVVLALLVVTFTRCPWAIGISAFLAPWIDERFLLALPIAAAVRWGHSQPGPTLKRAAIATAAGIVPFIIARAILALTGGSNQVGTYAGLMSRGPGVSVSAGVWAMGVWMGVRAGWLFVIAWPILTAERRGAAVTAAVTAGCAACIGVAVILVWDIDRSATLILPASIAGALLLRERSLRIFHAVLAAALLVALATPAYHVLTRFQSRIHTLYTEVGYFRHPPLELTAEHHVNQGVEAFKADKKDLARNHLDLAVHLDPRSLRARISRATALLDRNDLAGAEVDAHAAIDLNPRSADAFLVLGNIQLRKGDPPAAIPSFETALSVASPQWPSRPLCTRRLAQARDRVAPTPTTAPSGNTLQR